MVICVKRSFLHLIQTFVDIGIQMGGSFFTKGVESLSEAPMFSFS